MGRLQNEANFLPVIVGLTRRRGGAEKDAEGIEEKVKPENAESAEICGASRVAVVVKGVETHV